MRITQIVIDVIPHAQQRYSTCGDYSIDESGTLRIKVSALSDGRREMLVAVHELVEVLTCQVDHIPNEAIDQFDFDFEAKRLEGNNDEPGDDPEAPYHDQHCLATGIERMLAASWGVDWKPYEQELFDLPEIPGPWHKPDAT